MSCPLATERVWVEKSKYHDAEKDYFEHLSKLLKGTSAKENLGNNDNNTTESVSVKVKKNKKFKAHANEAVEGLLSENDVTTVDKNNSEASKNDEVKAKKKKKKKNNKENSEKSQETNAKVNDSQDQRKDDSLKRQKSNSKLKAPATNQCALVSEIAKARQHIKNSLERMDGIAALAASPNSAGSDVVDRLVVLEKENAGLRELVESLKKCCMDTQKRVLTLETRLQALTLPQSDQKPTPSAVKKVEKPQTDNDNDDGVDLFASESEEDEEANTIREQRLAEYHAKKSKKPALIAKSSLVLDIKPWDDETDLGKMEKEIRKITTDGLLWGASKLQPVAFGIKKLVLSCVVEDEKVSIDWLTEEIEKLDDYVQSVDVAAFNKI